MVNAPEAESLAFFNNIDGYRQYTGPANIAGKRVISTECCADVGETYQQLLPEVTWFFKRSLAGSINNIVFHGLPYSGEVCTIHPASPFTATVMLCSVVGGCLVSDINMP